MASLHVYYYYYYFQDLHAAKTKPSRNEKRAIQSQHYKPPAKHQQFTLDKNYTLSSHSKFYNIYKDELSVKAIDCDLTKENYKVKFHHLLCWEEKEHCQMLEE